MGPHRCPDSLPDHWNKGTIEGYKRSIDYFQQAIAKDQKYALAYAGLADSYLSLGSYWVEAITEAKSAALQALAYGFEVLKLSEIVSFTAAINDRSRRLMERLRFLHDVTGDFDHPNITEGHELRKHVLYRRKHALVVFG